MGKVNTPHKLRKIIFLVFFFIFYSFDFSRASNATANATMLIIKAAIVIFLPFKILSYLKQYCTKSRIPSQVFYSEFSGFINFCARRILRPSLWETCSLVPILWGITTP